MAGWFFCFLFVVLLRMALILEPMHFTNMWITRFFLGRHASNVALGNIFLSAPATAKQEVVISAVQCFILFVA